MGWGRHQAVEGEFDGFAAEVAGPLLRTGHLMTGDADDAEDLVQETLLRVARRWKRVRSMEHPAGYARRVLVNLVLRDAGRRKGSNATGRGNPYLSAALGEAAAGAGRTQPFLGARYRRMVRRMPKKKALAATGNSMLTIIHALLADPAACYTDLGADYHEQRLHTRRQARNHVRGLQRPGYQVTIQAINPDTGEFPAPAA